HSAGTPSKECRLTPTEPLLASLGCSIREAWMHRGWTGSPPAWLLMTSAGILALSALSLPRRPYTGAILKSDPAAGGVPGKPGGPGGTTGRRPPEIRRRAGGRSGLPALPAVRRRARDAAPARAPGRGRRVAARVAGARGSAGRRAAHDGGAARGVLGVRAA